MEKQLNFFIKLLAVLINIFTIICLFLALMLSFGYLNTIGFVYSFSSGWFIYELVNNWLSSFDLIERIFLLLIFVFVIVPLILLKYFKSYKKELIYLSISAAIFFVTWIIFGVFAFLNWVTWKL